MPTLASKIQAQLGEDIISGKYAPGTRLDERSLAETLGVSRTPVREALRQLATRGLVQLEPMRGAVVSSIGLKEVADLLNASSELEALCARISAESMSPMEKSELEYVFDITKAKATAGDLEGYLDANAEFHRLIVEGSHNAVLSRMVMEVRDRLSPFRRYHPADAERFSKSVDAHRTIVQHIAAGNGEQAYLATRAHAVQLGSAALRALREVQAASLAGQEE
ncbi:GntR family transcriptional regulator [Burkholderia sp. WAC0059]|uniref:GntR family transcriptional regulator n=1 Tax=Burkholderia sp. WAC0059 TaxID=2066022 RepID=UPI0015E0B277|nr:GntR family transcriptional regulator [Burkholderia sp. WAC0059]